MHYLREFGKFIQNMCNVAFLRHIFLFLLKHERKKKIVTKGEGGQNFF